MGQFSIDPEDPPQPWLEAKSHDADCGAFTHTPEGQASKTGGRVDVVMLIVVVLMLAVVVVALLLILLIMMTSSGWFLLIAPRICSSERPSMVAELWRGNLHLSSNLPSISADGLSAPMTCSRDPGLVGNLYMLREGPGEFNVRKGPAELCQSLAPKS